MTEPVNEELLSAYLDDEVTPDERALVEQQLGQSAAWRQCLEEMRSLRASIRALPRFKLNRNLDARVLAEAERQVLSSPKSAHDSLAAADAPRWRFPRTWRTWVWPALTLAAALLIKFHGENPGPKQVAEAPAARPEQRRMEPLKTERDAEQDSGEDRFARRHIAMPDEPPGEASIGAAPPRGAHAGPSAPAEAPTAAAAAPAEAPIASGAPAEAPMRKRVAAEAESQQAGNAPVPAAPADAMPKANQLTDKQAAPPRGDTDRAASTLQGESEGKGQDHEPTLVVRCELRPEAIERATFDHLLAHYAIEAQDPERQDPESDAAEQNGLSQLAGAREGAEKGAANFAAGKTMERERRVTIKAAPRQVAALLDEMREQPAAFADLQVIQPAPSTSTPAALGSPSPIAPRPNSLQIPPSAEDESLSRQRGLNYRSTQGESQSPSPAAAAPPGAFVRRGAKMTLKLGPAMKSGEAPRLAKRPRPTPLQATARRADQQTTTPPLSARLLRRLPPLSRLPPLRRSRQPSRPIRPRSTPGLSATRSTFAWCLSCPPPPRRNPSRAPPRTRPRRRPPT